MAGFGALYKQCLSIIINMGTGTNNPVLKERFYNISYVISDSDNNLCLF